MPYINRTTLENLTIIVPPLAIQHSIVNAHRCLLREKAFLDQLLDQTLEQYQEDNA